MSVWDDAVQNVENLTTVVKDEQEKCYDIFYDPTPKDVTIKKLNELQEELADMSELDWKMIFKLYLKD